MEPQTRDPAKEFDALVNEYCGWHKSLETPEFK